MVMLTGIALLPGVVVVGTVRLTGTILVTWSGNEVSPSRGGTVPSSQGGREV